MHSGPMIKNYQAQSVHSADPEDLNSKRSMVVTMQRVGEVGGSDHELWDILKSRDVTPEELRA